MNAAKKLLEWRKARGLSQRASAELAGLTESQWQSYEAGASPRAPAIAAITRVTGGIVGLSDWLEPPEASEARKAKLAEKRVTSRSTKPASKPGRRRTRAAA